MPFASVAVLALLVILMLPMAAPVAMLVVLLDSGAILVAHVDLPLEDATRHGHRTDDEADRRPTPDCPHWAAFP